jgi:hypothetical protein
VAEEPEVSVHEVAFGMVRHMVTTGREPTSLLC